MEIRIGVWFGNIDRCVFVFEQALPRGITGDFGMSSRLVLSEYTTDFISCNVYTYSASAIL